MKVGIGVDERSALDSVDLTIQMHSITDVCFYKLFIWNPRSFSF